MCVCRHMNCNETRVLLPGWKLGRFLRWTGGLNFWQVGWHTFACPSGTGTESKGFFWKMLLHYAPLTLLLWRKFGCNVPATAKNCMPACCRGQIMRQYWDQRRAAGSCSSRLQSIIGVVLVHIVQLDRQAFVHESYHIRGRTQLLQIQYTCVHESWHGTGVRDRTQLLQIHACFSLAESTWDPLAHSNAALWFGYLQSDLLQHGFFCLRKLLDRIPDAFVITVLISVISTIDCCLRDADKWHNLILAWIFQKWCIFFLRKVEKNFRTICTDTLNKSLEILVPGHRTETETAMHSACWCRCG